MPPKYFVSLMIRVYGRREERKRFDKNKRKSLQTSIFAKAFKVVVADLFAHSFELLV